MTPSSLVWLARTELRTSGSRSRGLLLAVVIGATLVVAASTLGSTLQHRVDRGAGVEYTRTDLVLRSEQGIDPGADAGISGGQQISANDVRRLAALPAVAAAGSLVRVNAGLYVGTDVREVLLETRPTNGFAWQGLDQGRFPRDRDEVALSSETLRDLQLQVGDRISLGTPVAGRSVFQVVGAVDVEGSLRYGSVSYGLVTRAAAQAFFRGDGFNEVQLRLDPGAEAESVIEAANASVAVGYPTSAADLVASTEQLYGTGLDVLSRLLTGCALIAGLVAAVVLAAVVSASLPARRARLAMLRAVGSTRGELRALVGVEIGALALLGGVIAVPLGIGVAAAVLPLLGLMSDVPPVALSDLRIPVQTLILVPFGALLLGILAALVPALQAGRVTPVDALRDRSGGRAEDPRTQALLGSTAFASIVALLLVTTTDNLILVAAVGVVVAIAVIAAIPAVSSVLAGGAAWLIRDRHPVGALAAAQLQRFPARVSSSGMAITLAAAVLSLSWVALGSIAATANDRAAEDSGPELMIGSYAGGGDMTDGTVKALSAVSGVGIVTPIAGSTATLKGPRAEGPGSTSLSGNVVATDVRELGQATDGRFVVGDFQEGSVYLPKTELAPFAEGSTVTLVGPSGKVRLSVRLLDDLPFQAMVEPSSLRKVGAIDVTRAAWINVESDADRRTVLDDVRAVAIQSGGLPVSGSATSQVRLDRAIDLARGLATWMLGLSVLVAILGAALTLATTVRERSAELATLRILGMDGAAVRRLVAVETWATGTISIVAGLALGVVLGAVSVLTAAGSLGLEADVRVPLLPLALLGTVLLAVLRLAVTVPLDRISTLSPMLAIHGPHQ